MNTMMGMADMLQHCMDMMSSGGSMMGSSMMDGNPMSWILPLALGRSSWFGYLA
jgi:hypothetical protein